MHLAAEPPRVSVITIFFNEEAYFREAIDSVSAQDFEDFELILVDDGSTDSSTAMAKDFAERDPLRVRYVEHPGHANRGMSASRNAGLAQARGEYVAFIDADDRWRPMKLSEQVALLDRLADVDAVGGSVNYWASHEGGKDRIIPTAHVRNRPIPPGEASLRLYPLGRAHAPSMSDLMFRRSSITAVGGFVEAFTGPYEDQAFLAKFYLESTLYFTRDVWSDYRLHGESCMAKVRRTGSYDASRRFFLEWFEDHLDTSRHRDNAAMRKALKQAQAALRKTGLRSALSATPFGSIIRAAKSAMRRLRPMIAPGPAILMYHRVAEERFDPWGLAISPANFADQLSWIARNRTPLRLPDFVELNRQGRLPRNAVAVTFDDGYACNAGEAASLLERYRIPATIFLPLDLIERGNEFWWDELQSLVLEHDGDVLRLDGRQVHLGSRQSEDDEWEPAAPPRTPRQRAYHELWSMLYTKAPNDLEAGMERLREQAELPPVRRNSHRPLALDEVRTMQSDLVEFGSHALTHPSLPLLDSQQKAREIERSLARCTELTGSRPRSFAYPYGNSDRESEQLVEQAGFACACKADGWFVTPRANRFALPRIFVGNWTSSSLARQLGRP